jgi:predicted GNAT family acetyltransferase
MNRGYRHFIVAYDGRWRAGGRIGASGAPQRCGSKPSGNRLASDPGGGLAWQRLHRLETHVPDTVRDNPALHRFELDLNGRTAAAYYQLSPGVITFTHTEVPPEMAGHGIGSQLVRGALEAARARGLKVVPRCPFVAAYMAKHAEFNDLLL